MGMNMSILALPFSYLSAINIPTPVKIVEAILPVVQQVPLPPSGKSTSENDARVNETLNRFNQAFSMENRSLNRKSAFLGDWNEMVAGIHADSESTTTAYCILLNTWQTKAAQCILKRVLDGTMKITDAGRTPVAYGCVYVLHDPNV
ncbi:hypothetical protein SISNIDRAFT_541733 [Sistotremastrum niveocremeum HHB9708]|uniref:Uncharacterized protein n=1 Tax=Sistotremastrum niveocremeum HHB9708 TaxID=1314777 RepID=A0A164WVE2_9AGAM|nr:hypothetical protein SISNIDRAFT_541733 [Sistotremastrum niveocremeum HHB9708]